MISAQELRIGNYIDFHLRQGDVLLDRFTGGRVTKIAEDTVWLNTIKISPLADLEPIPLTEEWLLKLGFSYNEFAKKWVKQFEGDEYVIEKQDDWYFIGVSSKTGIYYFAWEIKTVHRLQNIWHSVTGQELEVTI